MSKKRKSTVTNSRNHLNQCPFDFQTNKKRSDTPILNQRPSIFTSREIRQAAQLTVQFRSNLRG
jgi:hypothetical protein